MCSISTTIDLSELGMACKSCDNCKHSDVLETGETICFAGEIAAAVSSCYVCSIWKSKLD